MKTPSSVIFVFVALVFSSSSGQRGRGRNFAGNFFGNVHEAGSNFLRSVRDGVQEAGKVASVLAGDATDAIKTVASARIDDYIPSLEEDMNYLEKSQRQQHQLHQYRQSYSPGQGLVTSMLRMIGLDEHKLGMMALNMLVYLAEYLAKNFLGMESELENEIPEYRSIVQNEGMLAGMIKMWQDANAKSEDIKEQFLAPELSEKLVEMVPKRILGTDTSCIQMFLCKLEPAFWSIQTTTKDYHGLSFGRSMGANLNRWLEVVYQNLPDLKSLRQIGDDRGCIDRFPQCQLLNAF